jgi:phytoene/squalene synthetase
MDEEESPASAARPGEAHRGGAAAGATRSGETQRGGASDLPKFLSPSRYLAWLYSTDAQQPVLAALLEIEAEIASGLRPGIEHHVAHARLQWWSEEAERVAEGRPVHPLTRELVKARAKADISGFADTSVWDLASATFETPKELTAYCERWAAAMFETAATVAHGIAPSEAPVSNNAPATHGIAPSEAPVASSVSAARGLAPGAAPEIIETPAAGISVLSPWKTLGAAVREIELLADLAHDARIGRVRIPLDELDRAGVDPNTLAKLPWPAPLTTLLKERHETLRATIAKGVAGLTREEQMAQRGMLVWVALTWRLSVRAQRSLPNVILPRRYDALADGWQAWRAARHAASGNLRLS